MSILDVIEFAHLHGLVLRAAQEPDGCDAYQLRALPRPVMVWVRPDGRFSRAAADGEVLTLGQVMNRVVQAVRDDPLVRQTTS